MSAERGKVIKKKVMFPPGIFIDPFIEGSIKPPIAKLGEIEKVRAFNMEEAERPILSSPGVMKEYAELYGHEALRQAKELRDSIARLKKK